MQWNGGWTAVGGPTVVVLRWLAAEVSGVGGGCPVTVVRQRQATEASDSGGSASASGDGGGSPSVEAAGGGGGGGGGGPAGPAVKASSGFRQRWWWSDGRWRFGSDGGWPAMVVSGDEVVV
ncbi:hypothetical protein Q3G72_022392 [Acer saccharum]|nr:hypothetical protein Q3G72_022392 [Acer saccharum]